MRLMCCTDRVVRLGLKCSLLGFSNNRCLLFSDVIKISEINSSKIHLSKKRKHSPKDAFKLMHKQRHIATVPSK